MLVLVCLVISDLYLFHFMVLLNPDSNCSKGLLSSLVDKVTTGTYNFVPAISNVAFTGAFIAGITELLLGLAACVIKSVKTQLLDYVLCQNKIYFTINQ